MIMSDLFTDTGIAYTILLFSFVIATGLMLGRIKIKGVSIGSTWTLFVGILVSHFGAQGNPTVLAFMKDFGLILFVFAIGLQVGPGFFHAFKSGGLKMNLMAVALVLLAVLTTWIISISLGEDLRVMTGVMSGAVTNTPGLGAAQSTLSQTLLEGGASPDEVAAGVSEMASAYAVAYPIGVLGVIFMIILFKGIFKIDPARESADLEKAAGDGDKARRMHCEVENPAIFGKTLSQVLPKDSSDIVVSRLLRDGEITVPQSDTILLQGDKVLVVTTNDHVDAVRIIFGEEVPMHVEDWQKMSANLVTRRFSVTRHSLTGKTLGNLHIREKYGVSVTRINRAGLDLVAGPHIRLQVGDYVKVVGPEEYMPQVEAVFGNQVGDLRKPNLIPIFFGIVLGVILGSVPIPFPGIPQPVRLGVAGGPLVVSILLGYFAPRMKITTYTTVSANMMIREIGICFFMAAVGLGAGGNFVESIVGGGYMWILYGALITIVPIAIIFPLCRLVFKMDFFRICGLISGGMTDPAVLAFAQEAYGTHYTSVNYATVYPLAMFLRVLVAQLLILFTF